MQLIAVWSANHEIPARYRPRITVTVQQRIAEHCVTKRSYANHRFLEPTVAEWTCLRLLGVHTWPCECGCGAVGMWMQDFCRVFID